LLNLKINDEMKTTNLKYILLSVIVIFAVFVCRAQDNQDDKNIIRLTRDLPEFNSIDVGGAFTVYLKQGEPQIVEVETKGEFMDKVETKVNDGILEISSEGIKNVKVLNIYITMKDLTFLETSGAATVKGQTPFSAENLTLESSGASQVNFDLTADELQIEMSGASDMTLSGKVRHNNAELSGASHLQASDLETQVAFVSVSGASTADVNVLDEVTTEISGAGNVNYKTEPRIMRTVDDKEMDQEVSYNEEKEEHISVSANESGDTTKVKVGNMSVEVINDDSVSVTVGNNKIIINDDGHVEFHKGHKQKFNGHWGGFQMGVNGYLTKDGSFNLPDKYEFLELNYAKSLNYQLNFFEQNINLAKQHFGLVTGIGIQWTIYCLSKDIVLVSDSKPIYGYHASKGNEFNPPYPDRDYIKSKLRLTYLTVPVLFEYQTNRFSRTNSFHVTAGVVGGWAFNIRSKAVWDYDGKQKRKVHDDYGIQPFRWDAYAGIGWGKINLFGTCALNTLFKEGKGPVLYPFTLGLAIIGW
jgi:hypothetical protein